MGGPVELLSAACNVLLLLVFGAAAVGKVRTSASLAAFADAVVVLGRVPVRRAGAVAKGIVALEAATALLLLIPPLRSTGLLLATVLLATFTTVVARALRSRAPVSCRCFGGSAGPVGPPQLTRNAVLLLGVLGAAPGALDPGPLVWQAQFTAWLGGAVAALVLVTGEELIALLRRPTAPTTHSH
ncbi:MauE/DoxX family redox-associated membrane protein [Streptomyces platensis]|uniref:MauE/DoxX family redox-associated membrane protein n=1 Tax=Streptomyces platensis TaxID=58346 RepID=UPI003C2F18F2